MLTSERQKRICAKYSARDADGHVHCEECPLVVDLWWKMCRANAHYDRHLRDWYFDNEYEPTSMSLIAMNRVYR